jgi:DNA-directed RNA polymerase specialized sigma24 family protein
MNEVMTSEAEPGGLSRGEVSAIHARYGQLLLRRCRRLLRDHPTAEDALQESFVNLLRSGAPFRSVERELPWLYRVVGNCCLDVKRRRRWYGAGELAPDDAPVGPPTLSRIAARRVLERLPVRERRLAILAWVHAVNQETIGRELGWSRQTVNKKLGEVRQRLARWLGNE